MAGTYVQCDKARLLLRSVRVNFDGLARLEFLKGRQPVTGFNCALTPDVTVERVAHVQKKNPINKSILNTIYTFNTYPVGVH